MAREDHHRLVARSVTVHRSRAENVLIMHGACGGTRIRRDKDARQCACVRRDVQVTSIRIVLFMTIPAPFPF